MLQVNDGGFLLRLGFCMNVISYKRPYLVFEFSVSLRARMG